MCSNHHIFPSQKLRFNLTVNPSHVKTICIQYRQNVRFVTPLVLYHVHNVMIQRSSVYILISCVYSKSQRVLSAQFASYENLTDEEHGLLVVIKAQIRIKSQK